MKNRNVKKKLSLKKINISSLDKNTLLQLKGGNEILAGSVTICTGGPGSKWIVCD